MKYEAPEFNKSAFNCPHCQAYSHQTWFNGSKFSPQTGSYISIETLKIVSCSHCKNYSLWVDNQIIYPNTSGIPNPNEDLNPEIQDDYFEAASIINKSPRAAAALLRLAIQKLCKQLGETGNNINGDIANLVKKGLPKQIQEALDIVRVIGNESVHPGQIDLNDNKEIAIKLFDFVNIIANIMITQPKDINGIYKTLPEKKLEGIKKRDSKA